MTRAESLKALAAEFFADGVESEEIAKRLGISVDRVESILDQLDEGDGRPSHPDDEHRAPAVEPVRPEPRPATKSGPIVVGSPARAPKAKPVVEVRPVPEPADEDLVKLIEPAEPDEQVTTSDLVMTDQQQADIEALRARHAAPPRCGEKQGTNAGYQWHVQHDVLPACDPCAEAHRKYNNDYTKSKRAREHGTAKGARQHWGAGETACDPCREAFDQSRKSATPKSFPKRAEESAGQVAKLTRPTSALALVRPEGAVAHLTLPLSIHALNAVAEALEVAYGPGLRLAPADGGVWVLGAAS